MFKDPVTQNNPVQATSSGFPKKEEDQSSVIPIGLRLVSRPDGYPYVSLSLVLLRQPNSHDQIRPLVKSGLLTFQLMLDANQFKSGFFARQVIYTLLWKGGNTPITLQQMESQGSEARVAFSVPLDQNQSLDALNLLDYRPSSFYLAAKLYFHRDTEKKPIRIKGLWQDISSFLLEHCDENLNIRKSELTALMPAMQSLNLLSAVDKYNNPITIPSAFLTRIFLRQAGVILRHIKNEVIEDPIYELRDAKYLFGEFEYTETISFNSDESQALEISFSDLLKQAPKKISTDQCIFLLAQQDNDPSRIMPVKANVASKAFGREVQANQKLDKVAVINGSLTSVSLAIQPVTTNILMAKPEVNILNKVQLLNLLSFDLFSKKRAKSLPIVTDVNAAYFEDRLSENKAWYAPKFVLAKPALNDDPQIAPFRFTYESKGATNAGKTALVGKLSFALQMIPSEETLKAIKISGRTEIMQLPLQQLCLNLLLPFIDEADGNLKQYAFPVQFDIKDDQVQASVEFSNDWLRLAYGSLSTPGFQSSSIQVQIRYLFSCYNPAQSAAFDVIFGAKSLKTEVHYNGHHRKLRDPSIITSSQDTERYFDAEKLSYNHPISNLQFKMESPSHLTDIKPDLQFVHSAVGIKPLPSVLPATIKPLVYLQADLIAGIKKFKYHLNTLSIQLALPLIFPCNVYGNFYQERIHDEYRSIGCQDAFKLGAIVYQEYEEILDLKDEQYRIFRSLAQPGRFVLVPERYCIARRELGESDAYRPLIFLNALLDPDTAANNRVELRVTMQPDVLVFKIHRLINKLKSYHPNPIIDYPINIQNKDLTINWAIDSSITATSQSELADASGPFISTCFISDLPNWQLLKAVLTAPGLNGTMSVSLADGSCFTSNLMIKLDVIRGTWQNGPLQILAENGQITLTNKTEGKINVIDLQRFHAEGETEVVPVEKTLDTNESCRLAAEPGFIPTYSYAMGDPVSIEEIRSFVEEIYGNFIIVNLLNFANHHLLQLGVEARIQGLEEIHQGTLTETERVIDFDYVLPLTRYLEQFKLDFRITKIYEDRPAELSNWMVWDLNNGPLSITPDLLTT